MSVYFISDLHLGARYRSNGRDVERKAVEFLDEIKGDATEIFLLGDILDYWFEYRYVVPRGYVRFFGKLAELTDSGIKVTWIIGNHDIWIFDYIPEELGVEVIDGVLEKKISGTIFCIQHGDALGGSKKFRFLRALFRNKICQKLYSGLHPRWTVGFAHGCSRRSRIKYKTVPPEGSNQEFVNKMKDWCLAQIKDGNPSRYYMFGHLHRLYDIKLEEGKRLVVIPAFPDKGEYAIFDGNELMIKRWDKYVMQHIC